MNGKDDATTESDAPGPSRFITATGVLPHESTKWLAEGGGGRREPSHHQRFLLSPRAVMLLVPLLALGVGLALTIVGQTALGASSRRMAEERCLERTASAGRRIQDALAQAEPLLDRLLYLAASDLVMTENPGPGELEDVAVGLTNLLTGRPGVTQVYIALPDGRFMSADPTGTEDATFQLTEAGVSRRFRVRGGTLTEVRQEVSGYDPRERDWYKLATTEKRRVFSRPYTFYFNQSPGITRVDAVLSQDRSRVLAVVGVDFDVGALTRFMADREEADFHSLVFTREGVVLAYPFGAARMEQLPSSDAVATYRDLEDPLLDGLFSYLNAQPMRGLPIDANWQRTIRYEADGQPILSSVLRLGGPAPDWYVATLSPESSMLGPLYDYRKSSLIVGALAMSVALLVGWALGRQILRTRQEATLAKVALEAARKEARELGSYRLIDRLGRGGMGEVWRARHRLLAREAAIKLIRTDTPTSDEKRREMEERFRREARAIAALRSRHTIELFDYGLTQDGTLYYVMELLDGIDLETLVEDHGPQEPERVRRILIQACHSLAEAHDAGLVHRDIKPANLILCRAAEEVDVLKVLDFGLVLTPVEAAENHFHASSEEIEGSPPKDTPRHSVRRGREPFDPASEGRVSATERSSGQVEADAMSESGDDAPPPTINSTIRLTQADMQLGTPGYMSPEQALGATTDHRADLYALGCVAFRLLTGRLPFTGDTAVSLMLKHVQAPAPDVRTYCEAPISDGLAELIGNCLQKSVEDRPRSAKALADALALLGTEPGNWSDQAAEVWWRENMKAPPRAGGFSESPPAEVEIVGPRT